MHPGFSFIGKRYCTIKFAIWGRKKPLKIPKCWCKQADKFSKAVSTWQRNDSHSARISRQKLLDKI